MGTVDKRKKRILQGGFFLIILFCVMVFVIMTVTLNSNIQQSVNNVSKIYMSEMNIQYREKFNSIVQMHYNNIMILLKEISNKNELMELAENDENIFGILLYSSDGEIETVYGEELECSGINYYNNSLNENGRLVTNGVNKSGKKLFILGVEKEYKMNSGKNSRAVLIAMPMEYLNGLMSIEENGDSNGYSHIIDIDGNYIIRNGNETDQTYFERLEKNATKFNGKTGKDYSLELKNAMNNNEDYYMFVSLKGELRHIYCAPLSENSSWFLISVMPNGPIKDEISNFDKSRRTIFYLSVGTVIIALIIISVFYYRLMSRQIKELNEMTQKALSANTAKSEFLSSMSHDIRTPLNAIIGMTEIAMRNIGDPVKTDNCLKKIELSSKHLLGLINDVLDMSKIESGKITLNPTSVSLRDTLDDIVNIVRPQIKERQQHFDIFIRDILSEDVYCDNVRINQVLINIISNAVKFTPHGGRIDIYMHQEQSPLGDDYVRTHFSVIDTGIGMSKEFQKRIFETFAREDTEEVAHITGTGLGMAITKKIIDLMGGIIEIESEQGKGSKFHIVLDFKKSEIHNRDLKLPADWNILVVDDNEMLCTSAVSNLEELGVKAEWTTDGEQAVNMIEERHKANNDYHFVLIDWKMPNINGIETINKFRSRINKKIPVFLISAYDLNDIKVDLEKMELAGFIAKPLFKSTLYEYLKKYAGEYDEKNKKNEDEMDFNGRHILLAEDIDINWEVANEILSVAGLVIERAINGKDCVEKFENSEIGTYDAILMDIRMPVMNGYDATKAIRELNRPDNNLPIIAMTADAFTDDTSRCLECGMNDHISKPIDVTRCLNVLKKYLK